MILSLIPIQSNPTARNNIKCFYVLPLLHPRDRAQRFCTSGTDWSPPEFRGENAYDILGVPETSSFVEIKASFRKLAKQTHPDLADSSASNQRFIKVLAAYEILSDSERRAHYDSYLLSQRKLVEKPSGQGSTLFTYKSQMTTRKEAEVVEWLKWYRLAVNDIMSERKVAVGTGAFDILEADFYSAIHAAFYGPLIESLDLLPDQFEAEERSFNETPDVLHLVSGRYLFGMVRLVNESPKLSSSCAEKLNSSTSLGLGICQSVEHANLINSNVMDDVGMSQMNAISSLGHTSDAYKDLELHVSGRVVAIATRTPPNGQYDGVKNNDGHDRIHVFLAANDNSMHISKQFSKYSFSDDAVGARIPLGTILGLGTSPEEGSCFVYDSSGSKTHVIMKHRTLMVKHMHWYGVQDRVVCECRCSRARLPPSKYWLFEPRCGMHDIGGWYVETFGRDKKGRTVPSQRYWDGFNGNEQYDKRLHPAMYLLALAYRTLDIEDAKRNRWTARGFVEGQLLRILHWCRKLV